MVGTPRTSLDSLEDSMEHSAFHILQAKIEGYAFNDAMWNRCRERNEAVPGSKNGFHMVPFKNAEKIGPKSRVLLIVMEGGGLAEGIPAFRVKFRTQLIKGSHV